MSSFGRDRWRMLNGEILHAGNDEETSADKVDSLVSDLMGDWKFWILDKEHNAIAVPVSVWMLWTQEWTNKIVKQEHVGDTFVSTVLLMVMGDQPIFETMLFHGEHGDSSWQCHTWDEAIAQHDKVVHDLQEVGL